MQVEIVPIDTKERDEIFESEIFYTTQAFLNLSLGNNCEYDTLHPGKLSSKMEVDQHHNLTAPAFVTTCNKCYLELGTGQGWCCEVCTNYDVCNSCYKKDRGIDHPHKLTNHPSIVKFKHDAANKEALRLRFQEIQEFLVHTSQCHSPCQYHLCRELKGLFLHVEICEVLASGGCFHCKRMSNLVKLHVLACKESVCSVPRCRDIKERLRRLMPITEAQKRVHHLVHASQCRSPCQDLYCRSVKELFRHAMLCKVNLSGGCSLCKKLWLLFLLHAHACKESKCSVPRCRDIMVHMMRQLDAKMAGNNA